MFFFKPSFTSSSSASHFSKGGFRKGEVGHKRSGGGGGHIRLLEAADTTPSTTPAERKIIAEHSNLGPKGYTISKEVLAGNSELAFLYKELVCKPEVNNMMGGGGGGGCGGGGGSGGGSGGGGGGGCAEVGFPVYRENEKKIYVPRFFGIERYGPPGKSSLSRGADVSLQFAKELRDYQQEIVDVYLRHVGCGGSLLCDPKTTHGDESGGGGGGGGILEVPCGKGKTVMALKILAVLGKKTIILVHKEFLMNQWIERIEEFLPGTRVGKIQGNEYDVQDKDVVLAMIQTIYDKDHFDYSSFGLTIVDEVHRIGSEQFSRSLLKVITWYMLGISATVERKDKLSKLLYMFIGPKVYSEKRSGDAGDNVCVRAVFYQHQDPEFNESLHDFRGNPQFSRMISKLCEFQPRTKFVVRLLMDLLVENPTSQMIVLAQHRNILEFVHADLAAAAGEEAGFYVGGMKHKDLQESENRRVVLATYAMASEGLDIKSLTTLVMITPKTDIIQSVGRILRTKHENPVIVDIVDAHDVFKNQWNKRKAFYKQCKYRIVSVGSDEYKNMQISFPHPPPPLLLKNKQPVKKTSTIV